jgi:hypothetical protein
MNGERGWAGTISSAGAKRGFFFSVFPLYLLQALDTDLECMEKKIQLIEFYHPRTYNFWLGPNVSPKISKNSILLKKGIYSLTLKLTIGI